MAVRDIAHRYSFSRSRKTVVPVSSLLIFLLLSALLGLVAASWPARRAARLDVLAAIAAE
jgi:ABC-type antimicrobial peptide transport system permease subunit